MANARKTKSAKTRAAPAATSGVGIHIAPGSCAQFGLGRRGAARAASAR